MTKKIGIRREDKNKWERRVPITPDAVRKLSVEYDLEFVVQPSPIRVYKDSEYLEAGAAVQEDLSQCPVVFAVKEIPVEMMQPGHSYVFFSHTIKGQDYNMPALKTMLEKKICLIDYERIVDEKGRRLVFFGRHAGLAGMIDSFWTLGQRLKSEGVESAFSEVKMAHSYDSLECARAEIRKIAEKVREEGVPDSIEPLVCGFAGYGNVSKGAQEIFDIFEHTEISPEELVRGDVRGKGLVKVVFKEEHIAQPVDNDGKFELQDYFDNPHKYKANFEQFIPHLTMLINCIYWNEDYPMLVTRDYLKKAYSSGEKQKLKVIGDITCDIGGSIECTLKSTEPGNPVYVYDPINDTIIDGCEGNGPVIMAVDNLPCELPLESSVSFSEALMPFVNKIAEADYTVPFEDCHLPEPVKKAVIAYGGELTPDYEYIREYF